MNMKFTSSFRLDENLKILLEEKSQDAGMNKGEFMRQLIENGYVKSRINHKDAFAIENLVDMIDLAGDNEWLVDKLRRILKHIIKRQW
ncbi:plasmid mobilization protein [Ekhidna sp.]|uniref:plasmid mobilization protein n=1 Tax=Ekhidna sp. TaxID=2608089 RepID=UPI003CCBE76E